MCPSLEIGIPSPTIFVLPMTHSCTRTRLSDLPHASIESTVFGFLRFVHFRCLLFHRRPNVPRLRSSHLLVRALALQDPRASHITVSTPNISVRPWRVGWPERIERRSSPSPPSHTRCLPAAACSLQLPHVARGLGFHAIDACSPSLVYTRERAFRTTRVRIRYKIGESWNRLRAVGFARCRICNALGARSI